MNSEIHHEVDLTQICHTVKGISLILWWLRAVPTSASKVDGDIVSPNHQANLWMQLICGVMCVLAIRHPSELLWTLVSQLDVLTVVRFLQLTDQMHDGHVGSESVENHAKELPIQLRNDLAQSLPSANESWDDILVPPQPLTVVCQRN